MVTSPNPGNNWDELRAVTVVPGTTVCGGGDSWAVGHYQLSNHPWRPVIMHYGITPGCSP